MTWKDHPLLPPLARAERLGLITDMDGTISQIVPVPADAKPTERSRNLLQALHDQLTLVAVVSGRSAADVAARVNLPDLVYIGNHGLERWQDGRVHLAPQAAPYRAQLEVAAAALRSYLEDGMWIEDKGATLSIHYRNAADPQAAAGAFKPHVEQIAAAQHLRVFQGRMIFELRPPIEVNKGTALRALVEEFSLTAAVYIGDDTTDADALRMARHLRETGVCQALALGVDSDDVPEAVADSSDLLVCGLV